MQTRADSFKIKKQYQRDTAVFNLLGYSLVTLFGLLCIIPFFLIISGSFSSEALVLKYGYSLLPRGFTLSSYELIFKNPEQIVKAYGISIILTSMGTAIGLFMTAMTAFVLNRKDFKYRNAFAFYFYFTTLFNGGIVSTYIFMVRYLHLKNSILALLFPLLLNVFYIIVMRSFVSSIPDSISESAKIDGAGDFTIFLRLILPLLKPALASVGLFIALDYWNDWYNAMLYINSFSLYPLQYLLYKMLNTIEALSRISVSSGVPMPDMPQQTIKLAMAVVAIGPIIFVYPMIQKYFVQGITVGAVKG